MFAMDSGQDIALPCITLTVSVSLIGHRRELCECIVDRSDNLFHCAGGHHGLQLIKADSAIDAETA